MTDLLTPLRSEHHCPACSGSFMPVSHPATTAAEAADREAADGGGSPAGFPSSVSSPSAVADLAALRSLLWYRGDLWLPA